jgi:hypothetical protein|tara:strand:+ start:1857 stop:2264 length:408 start_codon:yes stop_codon:yes gene_type:complete
MKITYWLAGGLLVFTFILIGIPQIASERVEVVDLYTKDVDGEAVSTRLWIVDDGGYQYLRVGADGSGWFSRLQANGTFQVTRNGTTAAYTAVLREDKSDAINQLMQAKYTWGDSVMAAMVGSREGAIPVELHPSD